MKFNSSRVVSLSRDRVGAIASILVRSAGKLARGILPRGAERAARSVNVSAADTRIADVRAAQKMMAATRKKILSRADTSLSGQANQSQRSILSLIQ